MDCGNTGRQRNRAAIPLPMHRLITPDPIGSPATIRAPSGPERDTESFLLTNSFSELGLSAQLLSALTSAGFDTPTPIQAKAIPPQLQRRDIMGIAQTGSGKTAAFGLPITIIVLRSFFRQIPVEVEEAATIDGCGAWGFFWRILLPMARPALATVSVLAIVASWNNFMLPLVVFTDPSWWTLPIGVQQFQSQYATDVAKILAYVVIAMIPALIFYSVAERQLIGGLTASDSSKG